LVQYFYLSPCRFQGSYFKGVQLVQKVAIYCRVSTADQSCARQERDLRNYAGKAGWKIAGVWKETGSGAKDNRKERQAIMALAQARKIDAILVTELTRWGRSTMDLIHTLQQLQSWDVSVIAQSGLQFDLGTSQGKLIASIMASLAEFESDVIKERVRSGIAAAKARGKKIGRQPGQRSKSDRLAPKVASLVEKGVSYREIAAELKISKTTVTEIMKRQRGEQTGRRSRSASPAAQAKCIEKTTTLRVWLRVENGSKFTRGRTKAIQDIESYCLHQHKMKKLRDGEYELIISYRDNTHLDRLAGDLLQEIHNEADLRNCFAEAGIHEIGTDRQWR
jgi:DNA invertase Pin-like site-specific DNA recombinase